MRLQGSDGRGECGGALLPACHVSPGVWGMQRAGRARVNLLSTGGKEQRCSQRVPYGVALIE